MSSDSIRRSLRLSFRRRHSTRYRQRKTAGSVQLATGFLFNHEGKIRRSTMSRTEVTPQLFPSVAQPNETPHAIGPWRVEPLEVSRSRAKLPIPSLPLTRNGLIDVTILSKLHEESISKVFNVLKRDIIASSRLARDLGVTFCPRRVLFTPESP